MRLVRQIGARREEGALLGKAGLIHFRQGDIPAAEEALLAAVEIGMNTGIAGVPLAYLELLRGHQGKFEEAHSLFDGAEERMRGVHLPFYGITLCHRGEVYLLQGDRPGAQRLLTEAEQILVELTGVGDGQLFRATASLRILFEAN